jgi:hypothetical protein
VLRFAILSSPSKQSKAITPAGALEFCPAHENMEFLRTRVIVPFKVAVFSNMFLLRFVCSSDYKRFYVFIILKSLLVTATS